jgi:hypothetical protein
MARDAARDATGTKFACACQAGRSSRVAGKHDASGPSQIARCSCFACWFPAVRIQICFPAPVNSSQRVVRPYSTNSLLAKVHAIITVMLQVHVCALRDLNSPFSFVLRSSCSRPQHAPGRCNKTGSIPLVLPETHPSVCPGVCQALPGSAPRTAQCVFLFCWLQRGQNLTGWSYTATKGT